MTTRAGGSRISHYRIAGELGRDRLGFVLRAVDEMLDRPVALKVVRAKDAFPADEVAATRERFKRDAQRAARIQHPALVTLYGFEQIGDADIIAMELVEGETLKTRLARGERWRALDAAALVARIADGLAAAHARHLVHGHLSIANVKVGADGRVKLLDLGIPKATAAELAAYTARASGGDTTAPTSTMQDDVGALARITCHLITGAFHRPADREGSEAEPTFPDPARALANFGVLAPILSRALGPTDTERFADASEFRDALVEVVRSARSGTSPAAARQRGGYHGPALDAVRSAAERPLAPVLETDGALGPLEKFAGEHAGPALVLPPDLADGNEPLPSGAFVVMAEKQRFARMRTAAEGTADRFGDVPWGKIVAVLTVLVVIATAVVAQRRLARNGDALAAILGGDGGDTVPAAAPALVLSTAPGDGAIAGDSATQRDSATIADSLTAADSAVSDSAVSDSTRVLTAIVSAAPAGTAITRPGSANSGWLDRTELSVPAGDSIVLRFVRPGYVSETHVFRGEPLDVALEADSVLVRFDANASADVLLVGSGPDAGAPRRIGTTPFSARLPSGTYRVLFRLANHDDWLTIGRFITPGRSYTVRKTDYVLTGDFVATVAGGWGLVSVDGSEEHETPFRFSGLSVGPHVLRLRRDGFRTVVDTITVRGGQVSTQQYTLVPSR